MVFLEVYYTLLDIGELGAEGLMLTIIKRITVRLGRLSALFFLLNWIGEAYHFIVTVPECLIAFVVSHLPFTLAAIATL